MLIDFDAFEAVLLDLDGTLCHEDHALPGAIELVERLRAGGRKYACMTNSTHSPETVVARLHRMGIFGIDAIQVYSAANASADYVLQTFAGPRLPRVFNLATQSIQEILEGKVQWAAGENEPCDAVICGCPVNVYATEDRQRTAMLLVRKGATLVGICADRVYPSPRGLEIGVGALTTLLAYAAGVRPIFCGKPEKLFFNELCGRMNVRPERCVLIGDNLESDIAGAKGVGMKTILTLTGVARREEAERLAPTARPDWVIGDLTKLI